MNCRRWFPYRTATGAVYDSGDYVARLDEALTLADADGFRGRRAATERRGKRRGLGVGLQAAAELDPVHAGHLHVEHDHVGPAHGDARERRAGAVGLLHVDVDELEGRPEQRPETGVVIDEQQFHESQ